MNTSFQTQYDQADAAINRHDAFTARAILSRLLDSHASGSLVLTDDELVETYLTLGFVYLSFHSPALIKRYANLTLAISPDNIEAKVLLAYFYNRSARDENYTRSYLESLIADDIAPLDKACIYYSLGKLHRGWHNLSLASENLKQALDIVKSVDPANILTRKIYYIYSLIYNDLEDYARALQYLDLAIEISPRYVYLIDRGEVNLFIGNICTAMEDFHKVLEMIPDDYQANVYLSFIYEKLGYVRYEFANSRFNKLIAEAEFNIDWLKSESHNYVNNAYFLLSEILNLQSDETAVLSSQQFSRILILQCFVFNHDSLSIKLVLEYAHAVLKDNPNDIAIRVLATYYQYLLDYDVNTANESVEIDKLKDMAAAATTDNERAWAYFGLARIHAKCRFHRDHNESIKYYDLVMSVSVKSDEVPNYENIHNDLWYVACYSKSLIYGFLSEYELALDMIDEYLAKYDLSFARVCRANIYSHLERFKHAKTDLLWCTGMKPELPQAYDALSNLYCTYAVDHCRYSPGNAAGNSRYNSLQYTIKEFKNLARQNALLKV